jgi:hypothetical protein
LEHQKGPERSGPFGVYASVALRIQVHWESGSLVAGQRGAEESFERRTAPLGTIRSLACLSPVIEEVLQLQVSQEYFQHLRHKLQRAASAR